MSIYEKEVPPRFRLAVESGKIHLPQTITTVRSDGSTQVFALREAVGILSRSK